MEVTDNTFERLELPPVRADEARAANPGEEKSDSSGIMVSTSRRGPAVKRFDLRREDGVALTEFALIVPVFLVIVAGLLGFGRVFFYWIEANHLASETARWAVVDRNPYGVPLQQHVLDAGTVEFQNARVCIDFPEGGTPELGDAVRVRIQKPFNFVPILGVAPITIRGSSTMRIERFENNVGPTNYNPTQDENGPCS